MTVRNMEWLDMNANRSYPIFESCTRRDILGNFVLPNYLIVDGIFCVPSLNTELFIKNIKFYESNIIINIYKYTIGQVDQFIGNILIDVVNHVQNSVYGLNGYGEFKHLNGKLVIGRLDDLPIGEFNFAYADLCFEPRVLYPSNKGVTSLQVGNDLMIGNVRLMAGYNCKIRYDQNTNSIYFDAIEGSGLGAKCNCEVEEDPTYIKTINGVYPDQYGNFNIAGTSCIKVNNEANGISVQNECEEICCDCEEVTALLELLDQKQVELDGLEARVLALGG